MGKGLLLALGVSGFLTVAPITLAEDIKHIDIFTTVNAAKKYNLSRLKLVSKMPVHVHYVDAIENFNSFFGGEIEFNRRPTKKDVNTLKTSIQKKLNSPYFQNEKDKLQEGILSFQKAKRLGITKIPAVVFDDKFIVYGETPIKSLKIHRQTKEK